MKVLNGNVLILENAGKESSEGGIILPTAQGKEKRTYVGTVVAVGAGEKMEDGGRYLLDVRVGDVVAFPDRVGDPIVINGQKMLVIQEKYLLCVLVEADVGDDEIKPEATATMQEYRKRQKENHGH